MRNRLTILLVLLLATLTLPPLAGGAAVGVGWLAGMGKDQLVLLFGSALVATFTGLLGFTAVILSLFTKTN